MTSIATSAFVSKNFGTYQDAAVRAPVIITKNGRPRTVLLTYEDHLRLARRDRRADLTVVLSDVEIDAVEDAKMAPKLDHLNSELSTGKNSARRHKGRPDVSFQQVVHSQRIVETGVTRLQPSRSALNVFPAKIALL